MYAGCNTAGYGYAYGRRSRYLSGGGGAWMGGYRRPKYNVPVNIDEWPDSFEVSVYATGFEKANIKLSVVDDVLYISGTRVIATEPKFTMQEFPVKSFERVIGLNGQVDAAGITAKQENGVLVVTLPKTREAMQPARDINVE
jgi:HSP20 family protein